MATEPPVFPNYPFSPEDGKIRFVVKQSQIKRLASVLVPHPVALLLKNVWSRAKRFMDD